MSYDVIVIGAGVNGLVAAALLARAGRRVLVLERRDVVGGVCTTEEFHPGFRANMCIDDPGWMPDALAQELDLARHGYIPSMSTAGAVFPTGGAPVVLSANIPEAVNAIRPHSVRDATRWEAFSDQVAKLAGMLGSMYTRRAPSPGDTSLGELWSLASLGRSMRGLGKRGMIDFLRCVPMPVSDYLDEWFENEALKGALAFGGVTNVQHGPLSGGTTLVFLHQHVGMLRGLDQRASYVARRRRIASECPGGGGACGGRGDPHRRRGHSGGGDERPRVRRRAGRWGGDRRARRAFECRRQARPSRPWSIPVCSIRSFCTRPITCACAAQPCVCIWR